MRVEAVRGVLRSGGASNESYEGITLREAQSLKRVQKGRVNRVTTNSVIQW